jgi:hypothetical protein
MEGTGEKGYSPAFYIDIGDYSVALEKKMPSGIKFFSVGWKEGADSFLMLATEESPTNARVSTSWCIYSLRFYFEKLVERNSLQAFGTDTNIVYFALFHQQMFICCLSDPTSAENFRENYQPQDGTSHKCNTSPKSKASLAHNTDILVRQLNERAKQQH